MIGANCSVGPQRLLGVIGKMQAELAAPAGRHPPAVAGRHAECRLADPGRIPGGLPILARVLRRVRAQSRRRRGPADRRLLRHHAGAHRGDARRDRRDQRRARAISRPEAAGRPMARQTAQRQTIIMDLDDADRDRGEARPDVPQMRRDRPAEGPEPAKGAGRRAAAESGRGRRDQRRRLADGAGADERDDALLPDPGARRRRDDHPLHDARPLADGVAIGAAGGARGWASATSWPSPAIRRAWATTPIPAPFTMSTRSG